MNQLQADSDDNAGAVRGGTDTLLPISTLRAASEQQLMLGHDNSKGNRVEKQGREIGRQTTTEEENLLVSREAQMLLVSSGYNSRGGYSLSYMSSKHPVYNVLCLRHHPGNATATTSGFERIGLGRLFGRGVQRLFEKTEPQELQLF